MFHHILVALDGSEDAEKILPYVEAMAKAFDSEVTLLGATDASTGPGDDAAPATTPLESRVVDPTSILRQDLAETTTYLTLVSARLRFRGIAASVQYAEGPAVDVIVAAAEQIGADLIAMTTYGRGGIGRLVYGSVADEVVRRSPCPILLVRLEEHLEAATVGLVAATEPGEPALAV